MLRSVAMVVRAIFAPISSILKPVVESATLVIPVVNLFKPVISAIATYIRDENNSPIGRANLAIVVMLIFLDVVGIIVPTIAERIIGVAMGNPPPDWTAWIPVVTVIATGGIGLLSLRLIPPEPRI